MKELIDNLYNIFEAARLTPSLSSNSTWKGFHESPEMIPQTQYPYISIEDGGERVEDVQSNKSQNHFYTVMLEFGVWTYNQSSSFDAILDLSNEIKAIIELEANRQKDGHIWAVNITTFSWLKKEQEFYRARQVQVDYFELESRFFNY